MSRKRFTAKEKDKAVQLLLEGNLSQKQVAQKFGCSIASLQQWKKAAREESPAADQCECEEAECCGNLTSNAAAKKGAADDLTRKFWNKNFRAVDMLLAPKDVSQEDAIKLVNEALQFAYDHFQK
jgi:transposase-like protein